MVKLDKKHLGLRILGDLEKEVMELLWSKKAATVREIFESIKKRKRIAYTTVMTIMDRLFGKGILKRHKEGKTYIYTANVGKEEFFEKTSQRIINFLLRDFGEVAIAQFANTLDQVDPKKLRDLREKIKSQK